MIHTIRDVTAPSNNLNSQDNIKQKTTHPTKLHLKKSYKLKVIVNPSSIHHFIVDPQTETLGDKCFPRPPQLTPFPRIMKDPLPPPPQLFLCPRLRVPSGTLSQKEPNEYVTYTTKSISSDTESLVSDTKSAVSERKKQQFPHTIIDTTAIQNMSTDIKGKFTLPDLYKRYGRYRTQDTDRFFSVENKCYYFSIRFINTMYIWSKNSLLTEEFDYSNSRRSKQLEMQEETDASLYTMKLRSSRALK